MTISDKLYFSCFFYFLLELRYYKKYDDVCCAVEKADARAREAHENERKQRPHGRLEKSNVVSGRKQKAGSASARFKTNLYHRHRMLFTRDSTPRAAPRLCVDFSQRQKGTRPEMNRPITREREVRSFARVSSLAVP